MGFVLWYSFMDLFFQMLELHFHGTEGVYEKLEVKESIYIYCITFTTPIVD
jgi:hypothetical protein